MDPDSISEQIITEGAPELGPVIKLVAADAFKLNEAIELLLSCSLVRRNSTTRTISIHRLVQMVLVDRMKKREQRQWAICAVKAVCRASASIERENLADFQQYLPHALVCAALIEQHQLVFAEAALLLNQTAVYLHDRVSYTQATLLYELGLQIREKVLEPKHLHTLLIMNNLGACYRDQGKYEQAETLLKRAVAGAKDVLEADHPHTANCLNNLATVYYRQGKFTEAESLLERALVIREKALGPNHPDTATTLDNLVHNHATLSERER